MVDGSEWGYMEKRNYGIDLLRVVSMLMIVVIHVLGAGGVIATCSSGLIESVLWGPYIVVYCAVNCFALISGYVLYSQERRNKGCTKYLELWFQVWFYGLLICTLLKVCNLGNVELKDFIKALLPVTFNQYWYFTAYTGIAIFSPWLNLVIARMNAKESVYFSIVIFMVFSCYSTFAGHLAGNPFDVNLGYSFVWLTVLYILGAFIRKYEDKLFRIKTYNFLALYVVMVFLTWCWKMYFGKITKFLFGVVWGDKLFVSYISPTILISASCLLIVFSRLTIGENLKKVIRYIAPASFGVYLLHVQPLVFENYIKGQFVWINNLDWYRVCPVIIGMSLVIFMLGITIDRIRIILFKLIGVQVFANKIEIKCKRIVNKIDKYLKV